FRTNLACGVTTTSFPSSKYPRSVAIERSSRPASSGARVIEHIGCDQLFEVAVVPPRQLQLLGAPEVELDVVLDREADAPEHLLSHRSDVAEGATGEQLCHRRETRMRPPGVACPRRLPDERLGPVDSGDRVGEVVGDRLKGTERR